ncbi:hypothetical protein E3N88_19578 [Mikania micrantha]|uniref:Uncharacterized protein n=1 Tax=Mikania micrantha TaxID=192012 RepID=A0A5N6NNL4_9ASTR|nr:hypothetical protein E3N88_19578 [Mikania micrantha]
MEVVSESRESDDKKKTLAGEDEEHPWKSVVLPILVDFKILSVFPVLGQCLMKSGIDNLAVGLEEYHSIWLPVTSKQVLHSRKMVQTKHGLDLEDGEKV